MEQMFELARIAKFDKIQIDSLRLPRSVTLSRALANRRFNACQSQRGDLRRRHLWWNIPDKLRS